MTQSFKESEHTSESFEHQQQHQGGNTSLDLKLQKGTKTI